MLEALEDAAGAIGLTRLRLDTNAQQPEALLLYEVCGYAEIADYIGEAIHCAKGDRICANARAVKEGQTTSSPTAVPSPSSSSPIRAMAHGSKRRRARPSTIWRCASMRSRRR